MQPVFEIDIGRANNLIGEWAQIAASVARQCKWRLQGQCMISCLGIALCNLDGLILVDTGGRPFAPKEEKPCGTSQSE